MRSARALRGSPDSVALDRPRRWRLRDSPPNVPLELSSARSIRFLASIRYMQVGFASPLNRALAAQLRALGRHIVLCRGSRRQNGLWNTKRYHAISAGGAPLLLVALGALTARLRAPALSSADSILMGWFDR